MGRTKKTKRPKGERAREEEERRQEEEKRRQREEEWTKYYDELTKTPPRMPRKTPKKKTTTKKRPSKKKVQPAPNMDQDIDELEPQLTSEEDDGGQQAAQEPSDIDVEAEEEDVPGTKESSEVLPLFADDNSNEDYPPKNTTASTSTELVIKGRRSPSVDRVATTQRPRTTGQGTTTKYIDYTLRKRSSESLGSSSGGDTKRSRSESSSSLNQEKVMLAGFKDFLKSPHMNKARGATSCIVKESKIASLVTEVKNYIKAYQVGENQATTQALVEWVRQNFYDDDPPLLLFTDEKTNKMTHELIFQVLESIAGSMDDDKRTKYLAYSYKGENVIRYGQTLISLGLDAGFSRQTIIRDLIHNLKQFDRTAWLPAINLCQGTAEKATSNIEYLKLLSALHQTTPGQMSNEVRRPLDAARRTQTVTSINRDGAEYRETERALVSRPPYHPREDRRGDDDWADYRRTQDWRGQNSSSSSSSSQRTSGRRNQVPMCWACGPGHTSFTCNFVMSIRPNNTTRTRGRCMLCPDPVTSTDFSIHSSSECPVLMIHFYLVRTNARPANTAFAGTRMDFYNKYAQFFAVADQHMVEHLNNHTYSNRPRRSDPRPRVSRTAGYVMGDPFPTPALHRAGTVNPPPITHHPLDAPRRAHLVGAGTVNPLPNAQGPQYREFTTHSNEYRIERAARAQPAAVQAIDMSGERIPQNVEEEAWCDSFDPDQYPMEEN